jgi:hypothetical protein
MNTSGIEILSGQDNAEQRNISALQLRDRNALNFGLVLFQDCDELFVARILFANALFVRKGNIRNAALLRFAAVFHNEMDTIADNDSHRIDPRTSASLRDGGLPCPAQASAAQWLNLPQWRLAFRRRRRHQRELLIMEWRSEKPPVARGYWSSRQGK